MMVAESKETPRQDAAVVEAAGFAPVAFGRAVSSVTTRNLPVHAGGSRRDPKRAVDLVDGPWMGEARQDARIVLACADALCRHRGVRR